MEKLQLGRNRKTDAEKPRMDPLMRALKALHSAGSPEAMTPEELERRSGKTGNLKTFHTSDHTT